jgi:hypothetical protein
MQNLKRYCADGLDLIVDINNEVIYGWRRGYANMTPEKGPDHARLKCRYYFRSHPEERLEGQFRTEGGWQIIILIPLPTLMKWLKKVKKMELLLRIEQLDVKQIVREIRLADY